jgi:DNA-binding response OmpR family regulator
MVLIVDDEPTALRLMAVNLQTAGYEVLLGKQSAQPRLKSSRSDGQRFAQRRFGTPKAQVRQADNPST